MNYETNIENFVSFCNINVKIYSDVLQTRNTFLLEHFERQPLKHILNQRSHLGPPENIRKPQGFFLFSGSPKCEHWLNID